MARHLYALFGDACVLLRFKRICGLKGFTHYASIVLHSAHFLSLSNNKFYLFYEDFNLPFFLVPLQYEIYCTKAIYKLFLVVPDLASKGSSKYV